MEVDEIPETVEPETSVVADASEDESAEAEPQSDLTPTHYSKLDINTLKVNELRNELAARNLDTKGLKVNLVTRLQSALDEEKKSGETDANKSLNESKAEEKPTKPTTPTTQSKDEPKDVSEKERRRLERIYRMNEKPSIVVHPNKSARGGRFDCHRVSLFSLLDYRVEEQKELNFEVSLFAEQFNEMLQRDCAFSIFKAINDAPEKETKSEQDGKIENGIDISDDKEPDAKRRRTDEESDETKVRRLRRTVHSGLLFSFTFYDCGRAGYIREHDLCDILHLLGLRYSKAQMRKLIAKVANRREMVHYHLLTDEDVTEGDAKDVVTLHESGDEDVEVTRMLALGNQALFDMEQPPIPSKIIVGGGSNAEFTQRLEKAEEIKKNMEFQFYQIKDELEKTRVLVNSSKDTIEKLKTGNLDISDRLKSDQKQLGEYKSISNTYHHLLRYTRDQLDRAMFEINKQFDKEKAKRDAEKAALEAEKKKDEVSDESKVETNETTTGDEEKTEEKEWQVVDAV